MLQKTNVVVERFHCHSEEGVIFIRLDTYRYSDATLNVVQNIIIYGKLLSTRNCYRICEIVSIVLTASDGLVCSIRTNNADKS